MIPVPVEPNFTQNLTISMSYRLIPSLAQLMQLNIDIVIDIGNKRRRARS
jgi:hypothetical protein